jgi:putative sterol carrier protein
MSEDHGVNPTSDFFAELGSRAKEPMLARVSGTLRFDLSGPRGVDHWYVQLHDGDVEVSQRNAKADAVISADKFLFDGIVTGRVNAMTAVLRNVVRPEGDLGLVMCFQRLFPGPDGPADSATEEAS